MKIKRILLSEFLAVTVLCGCSENRQVTPVTESAYSETTEITNPFTDADTESESGISENEPVSNFGWGINIEDLQFLTYENNRLVVPIKVQNLGSEFEIGFIAYVDGIIQPYSSDSNGESMVMQTFKIPAFEEETAEKSFELYINDISIPENSSESKFSIVSVVNPDYKPEAGTAMGENHSGTGLYPISLKTDSSAVISEKRILNEYDSHVFTDDEIGRFWIDEKTEYSSATMFLCPINSEESPDWMAAVSDDGVSHMKFYMYSQNSGTTDYRISVYKNNVPVEFNGGYSYIDMTVADNYMNSVQIDLEDVNDGDFVYMIAVPLSSEKSVIKMSDIAFFSEDKISKSSVGGFSPIAPEDIDMHDTEGYDDYEITSWEVDPDELGSDWVGMRK